MGDISVVMLTYNNYEKFQRCIMSMFYFFTDQRIKEILILDNGSHQVELTSYLESLENQVEKIRVIFSNENLGIGKGRKVLFDLAEGDYIISIDSDVIIINPPGFLEVFYKALNVEGIMLVGGGGGDHPFFPSMERENVINKDSPDKPEELKIVDEVAGWFHGFKTSILTRKGGQVYMDEQFSPFWAEDSDFCLQIRLLGGKCCIMGKGLIGHRWSSCDKKETHVTLENMWNKFLRKWYPKFNGLFEFDFDQEFYSSTYKDSSSFENGLEHYTKEGILKGYFPNKKSVEYVFPDISWNDSNINWRGNKYSIEDFSFNVFNYKFVVAENFKVLGSNILGKIGHLIFIAGNNMNVDMIKNLISLENKNFVICLTDTKDYAKYDTLLNKYRCSYCITYMKNFNFPFLNLLITFKELSSLYFFNTLSLINTEKNIEPYLENKLNDIQPRLSKVDKFNQTILNKYITLTGDMFWSPNEDYTLEKSNLLDLMSTNCFNKIIDLALKTPQKHSLYLSPRCSPMYALPRLVGYLSPRVTNKKTLYILISEMSDKRDIEKIKNNLSYFSKGDKVVINFGEFKHVKPSSLGTDYYYVLDKSNGDFKSIGYVLGMSDLNLYSNIVVSYDTVKIDQNIDEFLEIAKFKNIAFSKENNTFNKEIFSFISRVSSDFIKMSLENQENIYSEVMNKFNFENLWVSKKKESEDEIIMEYVKKYNDDGTEDFPLI